MPIRVLDAATVGKIAAGEVVERPASVVKEFIENSLDAGATSVTVEIREGGIDYLRVTDNGCGIEPAQVRMAFENHATSKIVSAENLHDIRTLGFRGEALPSVAAVARVEMTTRAKGQETGVRLRVEGGQSTLAGEVGCPEGTTIVMRDLFFNLPVRRAFLKKPRYEAGLIADCVARMILGNPQVAFKFVSNGRTVYHSFGDGKLRHAIFAVYGRETAENMVEIDRFEGGMRIFGCIGVGEQAKSSRAHQAFFINGRSVRCALLSQALEAACRERVTVGMYPMCALNLVLPPTSVDVNVHPNKLEVRFRDETGTRIAVEGMLKSAFVTRTMLELGRTTPPESRIPEVVVEPVPNLPPAEKSNADTKTDVSKAKTEVDNLKTEVCKNKTLVANCKTDVGTDSSVPSESSDFIGQLQLARRQLDRVSPGNAHVLQEGIPARLPALSENEKPAAPRTQTATDAGASGAKGDAPSVLPDAAPSAPEFRIIGTLLKTYILLETQDALILIDQHAAHERLQYEKLKRALEGKVAAQQLLTPILMRLSGREMAILEDHLDALRETGYEVVPFGERDIQVRAVPMIFGQADPRPQILSILDTLSNLGGTPLEARREQILQAACKSAVKAGDALSDSEITQLLADMLATGAPPTCPHGRPVFKRLTRREIEKMFKRIQ